MLELTDTAGYCLGVVSLKTKGLDELYTFTALSFTTLPKKEYHPAPRVIRCSRVFPLLARKLAADR